MNSIYLADWADSGYQGMIVDFNRYDESKDVAKGCEILLAYYSYEDYNGDAFVLFRKHGKLYEVNGGHCSCYDLEGQWEPEETSADALLHRLNSGCLGAGYDGENRFALELREVLAKVGAA